MSYESSRTLNIFLVQAAYSAHTPGKRSVWRHEAAVALKGVTPQIPQSSSRVWHILLLSGVLSSLVALDCVARFTRDAKGILWPVPREGGMYRFKDMRPTRRSSLDSSSEANLPPLPLPSTTPRYFPRPTIPRRLARLCVKLFWSLIFAIGLLAFYFGFPWVFWSQNDGLDAQLRCDFPLPVNPKARPHEFANAFAGYKHFGGDCKISSLEIHRPYDPICPNKDSMLTAMSSGGRIGRDAPYIPRGCDMQWYTTEEVCEILGRFSQVVLVGDSMLRHVIGALNIIVRENLGYGGVTDWNFDSRERQGTKASMESDSAMLTYVNREQCFCNDQFDVTECSVQGIYKTEDVITFDPLSLACPRLLPGWSTDLRMEQMVRYPIESDELERLEMAIDTNPRLPQAFILGHGLWNNLEIDKSTAWLNTVVKVIDSKLKLRLRLKKLRQDKNMPILLITPNAAGDKKPDEYLITQGNKALARFEHTMIQEAARQRIDHLGTWNMSIQANMYDGVHMDMRGNLLKAMMVMNWLNLLNPAEVKATSTQLTWH
ncbi:hypothetical protein E0Z10_g7606 [Xylaria hypoxylon]|uniref:Uncharacterized protein n=1 Tax=Xylaria hypoxylon TaxID=37992 RepID=A0A4Z0YQ76_9PEZI|nr:hypothetical protein E0Z10_g7606 [Xylaria hypoxylon]